MTARPHGDEAGAALVESVVALALVGLLIGGGHELHRAVVRGRLQSEATLTALRDAASAAELVRVGLSVPGDGTVTVATPPGDPVWTPDGCRDGGGTRPLRIAVPRGGVDAGSAPPVVLDVAAPAEVEGRTVVVRDPSGAPLPGVDVTLRDATGTERTLTADADGCVALPDVVGPALVTPGVDGAVGAVPIGAADGGIADATPLAVVVVPTGLLRVGVTSTGDLPDPEADALTWWSDADLGDPSAMTSAPDVAVRVPAPDDVRTVEAGRRTAVVGACGDPRAGGTTAAVDVPAGGEVDLVVVLGAIRVDAPTDLAGRVVVERRRACPAGGGRPRLVRTLVAAPDGAAGTAGGATAPVLLAVPDGTWEVRLEDDAGRVVAGPAVAAVAGPATIAVALP